MKNANIKPIDMEDNLLSDDKENIGNPVVQLNYEESCHNSFSFNSLDATPITNSLSLSNDDTMEPYEEYELIKPNHKYEWLKCPELIHNDGPVCRIFKGIRLSDDIHCHSNFFDDLNNDWFTAKTPKSFNIIVEKLKEDAFIKNNFEGYETNDPWLRISSNEDADADCDHLTRVSIIKHTILEDDTKKGILDFLLSFAKEPLVFEVVQKIFTRKMIKGSDWTIIEWFFTKGHHASKRKALGRTLLQIAYTLWLRYKTVVLYFDAIQMFGGHRWTDIKIISTKHSLT